MRTPLRIAAAIFSTMSTGFASETMLEPLEPSSTDAPTPEASTPEVLTPKAPAPKAPTDAPKLPAPQLTTSAVVPVKADVEPGAAASSPFWDPLATFVKHTGLAATLQLQAPRDAIASAALITRDGVAVVDTKSLDPLRYTMVFDVPLYTHRRFQIGAAVLWTPSTNWLCGVGLEISAQMPNTPVWIRFGIAETVFRYDRLARDVIVGEPLRNGDSLVPTDKATGHSLSLYFGPILRF